MSTDLREETLPGPIGESAPYLGVRVSPAAGAKSGGAYDSTKFVAEFGRKAELGELARALCSRMGIPQDAILLMHEGRTLNEADTLEKSGVTLPGPAARRNGARVELSFDVNAEAMDRMTEKKKAEQAAAEKQRVQQEAERQAQVVEQRHKEKERQKVVDEEAQLDEAISRVIGVPRAVRERLLGNFEALETRREQQLCEVTHHYLEPCSPEVCRAIEQLMHSTGLANNRVVRVYRNENETLQRRYARAKELVTGTPKIGKVSSTTNDAIKKQPLLDFMGPYQSNINEFPLWHGTPNAQAAGGICSNGFDIAFAGAAHGLAWGHGFYFADKATVSAGYAGRGGMHVNNRYSSCHVMLLCRVLCGEIKQLSSPPSQQDKERLTAECLGPGGTFGAKSRYHSICGGGWAYVCTHRDQVYPAYVIVYGY